MSSLKDLEVGGTELPPLLSVSEASRLLGITRDAGYRAARAGDLPTLRWGRRLYVPTARLREVVGLAPQQPQ
jgi:excisionase family DNA binding protein